MTAKRGRRPLVFLVRGTVGVAVLAYLFSQLQEEVAAALARCALDSSGRALPGKAGGVRLEWGLLACALGMRRPYPPPRLLRGGMFANLFLPTTVGGDINRAAAMPAGWHAGPGRDLRAGIVARASSPCFSWQALGC